MIGRSIAAAGAAVAAIALAVMSVKFAGAPPTDVSITRIRRRVWSAGGARPSVARVVSIPGYPAFYFPATALLILALRRQGARGSEALVIASVGGWAIHRFIKLFAHRRRRPRTMRGRGNEYEAFPSGHTTATTAIALTAANVLLRQGLITREAALALGVLVPLTVGASRVFADEHWSSDVLGGWIGGAGIAALAAVVLERA